MEIRHILIPITFEEKEDAWFMPGLFGTALFLQTLLFLREKRWFKQKEILLGVLGGAADVGATYFLLLATKWALPFEKAMLFPCYAVSVILFCNFLAYKLYREPVNIRANLLCSLFGSIG